MNKGHAYVAIAALIFGSMGIFVRMAGLSGYQSYFFAALLSLVVFALVLLKKKKLFPFFKKKGVSGIIIMGLFILLNNVTYFYAYQLTTIANATFVHYLAPMMIAVLAPLMLKEKSDRKVWVSVFLALLGLFILTGPAGSHGGSSLLGIILAAVSAVGFAFGTIYNRKLIRDFSPWEMIFGQMLVAVIALLPFIAYSRPALSASNLLPLIVLGIVHQGIAVVFLLKGIELVTAQEASIILYLEPVFAVVFSFFFLHEVPSLFTLAGGALIFLSCYLTVREQ
jgi:drug/metabolite transporter (DMT)-like permease